VALQNELALFNTILVKLLYLKDFNTMAQKLLPHKVGARFTW